MNRSLRCVLGLTLAMMLIALTVTLASAQTAAPSTQDPLVQVLVQKGVLTANDAKTITGTAAEQRDRLVQLLKDKGVLSAADAASVDGAKAAPQAVLLPATYTTQAKTEAPKTAPKPAAPTVIPAVAPIRVLQTEPSKPGGLIPDIKLGSGAKMKLYGFLKASAAYDTSSPYGNDFPLPGFAGNMDVGPSKSPEFHVKARAARFGSNFEWPDISPKVSVTGKLEADFEGDFTRVNNRNVSAIRSSQVSLRLAYGRVDYKMNDKTSVFLLAGQDWSPFGSSILPNMIESTIYGVGFGNLYEREPQVRGGFFHNIGGTRNLGLGVEAAAALAGWGNTPPFASFRCPTGSTLVIPAGGGTINGVLTTTPTSVCSGTAIATPLGNLGDQLGYGERQGPDSAKPNVEGRIILQWQADKAKGVAPAQIVLSGMHGDRTAIVRASDIAAFATPVGGMTAAATTALFKGAFPSGAEVNTSRWGYSGGFSIPTRYVTVIANYYRGTGLRWYFEGQLYQEFNDLKGTSAANTFTVPAIDSSATAPAFGLINGVPVAFPQQEPRAQGGFAELGFPLSRIFHANPAGRNAGWTLNVHYGYDSVFARDARRALNAASGVPAGGGRVKSDLALGNLTYKLNQFVSFAVEESYYRTRTLAGSTGGALATRYPAYAGFPARQWQDFRSEFFTIFTF